MAAPDLERTKAIFALLQETTTQQVIGEFLKSKGIASSGTWEVLRDRRILPAVANHAVTNEELLELLRAAEECGRQHVFLYKAKSGKDPVQLIDRSRIAAAARSAGLESILTSPRVLDQPVAPTFADIRWVSATADLALIIKEVYGHESRSFSHEDRESVPGSVLRVYTLKRERAVNVARLDRRGNLEIRLSSRTTGTTKYVEDLKAFWRRIQPFLLSADFAPVSLASAKQRLVSDKAALRSKIRFSNSRLRNDNGTTMIAATGSEEVDDLYEDAGAGDGLAAFLAVDGGHCEGSNFHFKKSTELSRDVHVIMSGEPNEFAITADCSAEDYEHVLSEIKALNKRIP